MKKATSTKSNRIVFGKRKGGKARKSPRKKSAPQRKKMKNS